MASDPEIIFISFRHGIILLTLVLDQPFSHISNVEFSVGIEWQWNEFIARDCAHGASGGRQAKKRY